MNCKSLRRAIVFAVVACNLPSASLAQANSQNTKSELNNVASISLAELMARALVTNPALKAAMQKKEAQLARWRALGQALYNPELDSEYESAEEVTKSIGISQQIDWRGKRGSNQNLARVRMDIAQLEYEVTRSGLVAGIAKSISNYERTRQLLSIRERILGSALKLGTYAQRRQSQGDIPLKELQTAQLALFRSQTEKNNAYAAHLGARQNLQALTGIAAEKWSLNHLAGRTLPVLSGQEENNNLRFKLAQQNYLERQAQVTVAEKQKVTDPTLAVKYGKEGRKDLFGVSLSISLPVRNSFSDELMAAKRDMRAAEFDLEAQRRLYDSNLLSNHSRISMLSNSWNLWQESGGQSLEDQYVLLTRLLENGEVTTLNYLLEIEQLLRTEEAIVDLKFNLELAWIDWFEQTNGFDAWMGI